MKYLILLVLAVSLSACGECEMEAKVTELEAELAAAQEQLAEAGNAADYTPGLCHTVFFWLREDLSEADRAAFMASVNSLKGIESVRRCYVGPPASTENRDVVDHSYDIALLVQFDDVAGQDAYQVDPIHLKFVEDQQDKWTKVVVYDNIVD